MGKRIVIAAMAFLAVCGMGVVVGSAGGLAWGSPYAGLLTFFTFLFAITVFLVVLVLTSKTQ